MERNKFKILCIGKGARIHKVINAVFNSVPHHLEVIESPQDILASPADYNYDLIVINLKECKCSVEDIRKINISLPDPSFIIIAEKSAVAEEWTSFENLKFLAVSEIESLLPVFLGNFYSQIQNRFENSFDFLNLLKNSLYEAGGMIIITNNKSDIIFMNREAKKLFQFQDTDYRDTQLIDYIIDGTKVWNYLIQNSSALESRYRNINLTFTDHHGSEHIRSVTTCKLDTEGNFFMLESSAAGTTGLLKNPASQYELLNKFADSIANELMNPVNNISGRIQLLQSDLGLNQKYKHSLESLEKQILRIDETMSKLLTFARLKQDTIPQKIDLNDLVNKILMEPSIARLLKQHEIKLEYNLAGGLPALSGLISHFNLLIKNSLEICFECLGNKGRILVETKHLKDYLKQNWIMMSFNIDFSDSLMYKRGCLQDFFKHSNFKSNTMSIESTIVNQIMLHYQGLCQIDAELENREIVNILFPLPKARNVSEDR
ncbi:MAG: histidine kinase dimerization/phospho-acceptor domain-containing protein [Calditrichaceae bacterium]